MRQSWLYDMEHECVRKSLTLAAQEPELRACTKACHILCGGEVLPPSLAERFAEVLPKAHLHNVYGPTEATVACTGEAAQQAARVCCRLHVATGKQDRSALVQGWMSRRSSEMARQCQLGGLS